MTIQNALTCFVTLGDSYTRCHSSSLPPLRDSSRSPTRSPSQALRRQAKAMLAPKCFVPLRQIVENKSLQTYITVLTKFPCSSQEEREGGPRERERGRGRERERERETERQRETETETQRELEPEIEKFILQRL